MAKSITGIVVSTKADKTIVVMTQTRKTHPIYKKQYTVSKKIMAHDPKNEANDGDKVIISETKPISKRKKFILSEIISHSSLNTKDLEVTKDENASKLPETKKKIEKDEEA